MGILLSCTSVSTIVWQHRLDSNETLGKKLDRNNTRMLRDVFNKS